LSFVQPNGIVGRTSLRSRKALALFVVLVLSSGALIFAAGEARAQQRSAPAVPATVTGSERTLVSDAGLAATLPADPSPSQVDERDAASSSSPDEPELVMPGAPEPALALLEELYPASWPYLVPEAAMPESFGSTFGSGPAYAPAVLDPWPVPNPWYSVPFVDTLPAPGLAGFGPALPYLGAPEPAWGLIAFEENYPPSSRVEERPLVLSPTGTPEGVWSTPRQGSGAAGAVPVGPLSSVVDRKAPPPGLPLQEPPMPAPPVTDPAREASLLLSSLEAAAGNAVETLHGAAVDVSEALTPSGEAPTEPPSGGGTKEPSEDWPPSTPPSPAPSGGSYFSPSVGGQVGPGGVVPLLICVLAVGLILLRPLVGRLSWASCELPKPSSVLLLPLERPG
jgi:hypothetical protein